MLKAKDITALEAWELLNSDLNFILIDTRTPEEWKSVGYPKLGSKLIKLSSHLWPNMEPNPNFVNELIRLIPDQSTNLIFMCKTNGRSRIAAESAIAMGYNNTYIISDGFLGSPAGNGWLASNLPCES